MKLGVNKMEKNPLQNYINKLKQWFQCGSHEYPHPNVYHIHNNDFKNVVQHLTWLQSNAPKAESEITKFQKIRLSSLTNVIQLDSIHVKFRNASPAQEFPYIALSGPPLQHVTGYHLVDK